MVVSEHQQAPAPAHDDPEFDPYHPFGSGDAWAIGVMKDSFNSLNDYLIRHGRHLVNTPLEESVSGYVYAIFRVAEVIRELP